MTKQIPNFLTALNLLCGTFAIFFAIHGRIELAAYFIFAGAIFDFSDGFAARALNAYSEIGKQLDSLADLISFGLAPAAIYSTMLFRMKYSDVSPSFFEMSWVNQSIVLFPFVLAVFAAFRLAKFNLDTRQTENFLGLTTTATGIFTASFALLLLKGTPWLMMILSPSLIIMMIAVFCVLLVSEVPMFSLKFKNFSWSENQNRFLLVIAGIFLIIWQGLGGISLLILLYILYSVISLFVCRKTINE